MKNGLHLLIIKGLATSEIQNRFQYLRRYIKAQVITEYNIYKKSVESQLTSNPTTFWGFFKNNMGNSGIRNIMELSQYFTP